VSYSDAFDPDDPTLIDRHPEYDTDKYLGDRPPTPTQQWDERYKLKASNLLSRWSFDFSLKILLLFLQKHCL
jgi:hypothetical protein